MGKRGWTLALSALLCCACSDGAGDNIDAAMDTGVVDTLADRPGNERALPDVRRDLAPPDSPGPDLPPADGPVVDASLDKAAPDKLLHDLGPDLWPGHPPTQFSASTGGPGDDWAADVAVDSAGNSYVTGHFDKTVSFGATTLTSAGKDDVFVTRLDNKGQFKWAVSAGGKLSDGGKALVLGGKDGIFLVGTYRGKSASFGKITLKAKSTYSHSIFVARLNKSGKFLWASQATGKSYLRPFDIAIDGAGELTIVGEYVGTFSIGTTTLSSVGNYDIFVARFDAKGKLLWAMSAGGKAGDEGRGLVVDSKGSSTIVGGISGAATFGTLSLTPKGVSDVVVARLDKNGKFLWATTAGGAGSPTHGNDIARDSAGNCYITGRFWGKASFGSATIKSSSEDIFVAKLDKSGKFLWVKSVHSALGTYDYGWGIAADGAGNSYVTGAFGCLSKKQKCKATFGSTILTARGFRDIFVTKLDKNGKFLWSTSTGGIWNDLGNSVALHGGSVTLAGGFYSTAGFGGKVYTASVGNLFVWRLKNLP